MKILHIDSSIQGQQSASRQISAAIAESLCAENTSFETVYRDLAAEPLPHLTLAGFEAAESQAVLAEFQAADVIVIGAGMYNFTIPSQLKSWIDRILVAGQTFHYTEGGPEGLSGKKRVIIALARGGLYGEGSPAAIMEHAETYLRCVFSFIGVHDIDVVIVEGLALSEEARASALAAARERVAALAA
jgi:FMN-dependent NADH-azoreductase